MNSWDVSDRLKEEVKALAQDNRLQKWALANKVATQKQIDQQNADLPDLADRVEYFSITANSDTSSNQLN